jgi:hypothetical protein
MMSEAFEDMDDEGVEEEADSEVLSLDPRP